MDNKAMNKLNINTIEPNTIDSNRVEPKVKLTSSAVAYLKTLFENHSEALGVRIGVKASGCSGFSYNIEFVKDACPTDIPLQMTEKTKITEKTKSIEKAESLEKIENIEKTKQLEKQQEQDIVPFQIWIESRSLPYLQGIEIDCVQEGLNQYLTYNNPNAVAGCGCGVSFSVSTTPETPPK